MRDRRFLRQGKASEGARRRRGCGVGRCCDHGGRSRRAVRCAADAAVRCRARCAACAHSRIRFGTQSVRRDGADPGQSGIAQRLRRRIARRRRLRCAGRAADLRLRALGEAHPGLRFAGGQARQDHLHRLAERVAGRPRREGSGRGGACRAVPFHAVVLRGAWRRGTGERQSALPAQRHPRRHRPTLCSRQAR